MAIVRAVKSGNWSDTTVWNTGALPTSADDVFSNTFTITIDVSPTVLSISNASATGVTVGGSFVPTNGITLTCTASIGMAPGATATILFTSSLAAGQSCNIVANLPPPAQGTGNASAVISNASGGTLNFTGQVNGGPGNNTRGIINQAGGILNITGNVQGGTGVFAHGILNNAAGSVNVTGGVAAGGGSAEGIRNVSGGSVTVIGSVLAVNGVTGIASASSSAAILLTGPLLTSADGTNPVYALNWKWVSNPAATYYQVRTAGSGTIRPLYTADSVGGNPATSNVRSGTVYGPSNELTGTCAVPPAGSVALGVPVDNTTGTAAITAASIRSAVGLASANLDTQLAAIPTTAAPSASSIAAAVWSAVTRTITGGTVDTLTNAPDVPTEAEIATAVRTELSTELSRIDASTSSRLAAVAYTAPPSVGDIAAAVWAAATRTLTTAFDSSTTIAAAVWSAATRTLTSSSAPSAADNAAAVWGYSSGRTVTGGTVDTVTNSTPVDAGEIADAVRTELTPELARLSNAATTQEVGDIVEGALAD